MTWQNDAACITQATDSFNALLEYSASQSIPAAVRPDLSKAKQVCITACPVRAQCLAAADTEEAYLGGTEVYGVRGGLTARQRILGRAKSGVCAREGCDNPTTKWQRVYHIRRLCRSDQLLIGDSPDRFLTNGDRVG